jgi:Ca2+-binding RTX toxin-like protein
MTDNVIVRITVDNLAPANGTFLTPFWFGFHDGGFDQLDAGSAASMGIERLAEDGVFTVLGGELFASGAGTVATAVFGAGGPIAVGEQASRLLVLDPDALSSQFVSYASMIIPSNDAFVANDDPLEHRIFDTNGDFLGADFTVLGSEVWDAGTEVNTEIPEETAFFGQTVPDTGVVEGGVIVLHPGFIPDGPILSTPMFAGADFTQPGYEVARIRIELVEGGIGGTANADTLDGNRADEIYLAGGGDDVVFARNGADVVEGEAGNDLLRGGGGNDMLIGGMGDDTLRGGAGDDTLGGGAGDDRLVGGDGSDVFVFATDGGHDVVVDFGAGDALDLAAFDFADIAAALATADQTAAGVRFDFGTGSVLVRGTTIADFTMDNVLV